MRARTRDLIAVAVLALAVAGAAYGWHAIGRWAALAVLVGGVLVAAGVYRARRPAFPLRGEPGPRVLPELPQQAERLSTRRSS
jgi:hypothetical protein